MSPSSAPWGYEDRWVVKLCDPLPMTADPAERGAMGERARAYALDSRKADAYAPTLVDAAQFALGRRVHAHLTADLAARLRRLGGHDQPAIVERAADHAFDIYGLSSTR